jgi:hypothetical protein
MGCLNQIHTCAALAAFLMLSACGGTQTRSSNAASAHGAGAHSYAQTNAQSPTASVSPSRPGRPVRTPGVDSGTVVVNVLQDRHPISPLIYGANFPSDTSYITDEGVTLVRWGGNASTPYNWKNFDTNASADWYFQNRPMDSNALYQDSTNFVSTIANAGAVPIMTIGMLPWVAKDGLWSSYSFSVTKYGAQCKTNPYVTINGVYDDGNGVKSDCATNVTGNSPNDAYVPLLDSPGTSDPAGSVYRNQWVAALATKYGNQPHWYNMDNEIDIWAGTHRDIHPNAVTYDEMKNTFLTEARLVKTWDPAAVILDQVGCCWWFYWNSAAGGSDKTAHAGIDFVPWWLNEIAWADKVAGSRSLDVFDMHAYPDAPDYSSYTTAQKQALALRITRDWWDPTYTSESGTINQIYTTQTQPNHAIPFRIPRMRAILNSEYPNTPLSFTEWNAAFAGETDFSTALVDADFYGIMGRERLYAATRWTAATAGSPAYVALKLYRNYDGNHSTFGSISVAAKNGSDPNLFSSYAALNSTGTTLTIMLVNKDPSNAVTKSVELAGFNPSQVTSYTLSSASPTTIVAGTPKAWTDSWNLPAYSATLLVVTGSMANTPTEWDLNPDVIQMPASGTITLSPKITSASGTVTLTQASSDTGLTVALTQPNLTTSQNGTITVTAGGTPGFYHFAVSGTDQSGTSQTQEGWILIGNPAATLTKSGDGQSATRGTQITLSVTLGVGSSGGNQQGASILFTTDQGSLSNREVQTNASGVASVTLTLPSSPGTVHVTAEGPYGLGHPVVTFTETAQ